MSAVQGEYTSEGRGRSSGPRAGFWVRFAAALIDGIIVGIVGFILEVALKGVGYALEVIISIAYFTYLEGSVSGQTLGARAVGIRIISLDDGGPIGYGRAFIRWFARLLSAIVIFIGFLWMLWDDERQCWHDKIVGDVVVPVSAYPVPA